MIIELVSVGVILNMRVIRKKYLILCNLTFDCMPLTWTILNNLNCHRLSNDIYLTIDTRNSRYRKYVFMCVCVCVSRCVPMNLWTKMNRGKIYKNVIKRVVN